MEYATVAEALPLIQLLECARRFYNESPTGQYDEIAVEAIQELAMHIIDAFPSAERGELVDAFTWMDV